MVVAGSLVVAAGMAGPWGKADILVVEVAQVVAMEASCSVARSPGSLSRAHTNQIPLQPRRHRSHYHIAASKCLRTSSLFRPARIFSTDL